MVAGGAARWGTCAHRSGSQPLGLRPLGIYRAFGGYGGARFAGTLGVGLGLGAGLFWRTTRSSTTLPSGRRR